MKTPKLAAYLAALPDFAEQPQGGLGAAQFTSQRVEALLAALGQPQQAYPSLHVAGTNGKGSVCALCAAALRAAGHKVGLFTSPHVDGALRGIRVGGQPVPEAELHASFEELHPHLQAGQGWTRFEVVAALMFLHFARAGVDAAVIEVGLGGTGDATNVLTPLVSVITSIDYDHTSILGNTLAEIAEHKAGIIKRGVPVVISPQPAEARAVIVKRAAAFNAPLVEVGVDWQAELLQADLSGQTLRVQGSDGEAQDLRIRLLGRHQVTNAATAYAALQAAAQRGLQVDAAAIAAGFAAAEWPGRFEVLAGQPNVVLDGAHSPAAAQALRAALDDYFPQQPVTLLLGVSADKDLAGILDPLRPRLGRVIATQSAQPRAMPAAELAERLGALGLAAEVQPQPEAALAAARAAAGEGGLVLAAGSVFLVEQVRPLLVS